MTAGLASTALMIASGMRIQKQNQRLLDEEFAGVACKGKKQEMLSLVVAADR